MCLLSLPTVHSVGTVEMAITQGRTDRTGTNITNRDKASELDLASNTAAAAEVQLPALAREVEPAPVLLCSRSVCKYLMV